MRAAWIAAFALLPWAAHAQEPAPGQGFRDCEECPEMVVVPAGGFEMGLPAPGMTGMPNAKPVRKVSLGSFALGRTEVTRRQWRMVMGVNPLGRSTCDECPVDNASWNAAQEFVRRLSIKTGKPYRLPSEAEWEYACRAGGQHEFCGGDDADAVGWHEGNAGGRPPPVGSKRANAFGLHDMSGSVWEWTADCWNNGYAGAPADGSAWQAGACSSRVIRGGSWQYKSVYMGAIIRGGSGIDAMGGSDGFRVARTLP